MQLLPLVLILTCALQLAACGEDSEPKSVALLDPQGAHYGKTYAEWAAEWIRYVYDFAPPSCADPLMDETGAMCALGQDPASPVFFLVGTLGGPATRTECVVPTGAALFFPLFNTWADNAGLPPEQLLDDAQNKAYVEAGGNEVELSSLYARIDGHAVADVQAGFTREATPYHLEFPAAPNAYTCIGVDGVAGGFDGHVQGAWVMLAPLAPGRHVIEFGGRAKNDMASDPDFSTDVRYELTVR